MKRGVTRRAFIKGAAAGVGAVSVTKTRLAEAISNTTLAAEKKNYPFEDPPESIPAGKISREYSGDVVVMGLGNSGTCALRAAAEAGASVIGIEKMTAERFWVFGRDVGHINSEFLAGRGLPKVDPLVFFNDWMLRSGNRANPQLVMQFCRKSGEAFDWLTELFTKDQMDTLIVTYWPLGSKFPGEISGQKFWAGTARFEDRGMFAPGLISDKENAVAAKGEKLRFGMDARLTEGMFSLSHVMVGNQEKAKAHGAKLYFGMDAQQLVIENGRVVGVIAKDEDGKYVKYNANKGVILATGDFGRNKEMCHHLLPDMVDMFEEGEEFRSMGRDGRGIQMALWADGRLEPRPLPAMGGNTTVPTGVLSSFGTLWADENGRRFCNENFGDPVFAGFPAAVSKHGAKTIVFDSGIFEDLQSSPPAHMAFWVNNEDAEKELTESMAAARAAGSEGHRIGDSKLYAAEDIETLVDYIGLQGKIKENFLDTIRRYNDFCSTGRDMDFGKDSQFLRAIDNPPYYAQTVRDSSIGSFLVTVGGLQTDENQNVLDRRKDPIPGLYATGNCCGRRFGHQYSTPIAGVSIGMAVTLGREAGKIVAKQ